MSDQEKNEKKTDASQESPIQNGHSPRPPHIPDELLNMVGASPPKFVTFEQLMSAADDMKNMTLAHEIAVNNDFELPKEQTPQNSLEKQVSETMRRAFWDAFQEKIERDPPDYSMAFSLLEELKEVLVGILLPQQQRMKDQILEVLDMELIRQQIEQSAFNFDYYGTYVVDVMARLCAPARDEKIAEIRTIKEVVPKFKTIMETLQLMQRDMANFTIKQIRPYIQQNSIEYERKKFASFLEAQRAVSIDGLQYTKIWLKRIFENLQSNTQMQPNEAGASASPVFTPANIMTEAFLEVLEWPDPKNFPETLMMDQFRFMSMRDKLHSLALITSVQLLTYSVVGPAVDGVEDLKVKLKNHVEVLLQDVAEKGIGPVLESIAAQVGKDVNDSLTSRSLPPMTDESQQALRGQIKDLANRTNTVRKLMVNRLMGFMREGMSGKKMTNLRVPKGCSAVQHDLAQVFGNFLRLTSHNRSVFGEYYANIIERLLKGKEDQSSPRDSGGQDPSISNQHQPASSEHL
ncbi:T-complex protein 11-like protein 1 [Elysia marginata]|uniref:T-complex protein 11-like protein 1 n=1 Tax=Elysia marginata TaxID=1093978 RepID=A0AAV4FS83_9GAST|nr:T-complex protein 11-like protein 1 [Elysia marginata]